MEVVFDGFQSFDKFSRLHPEAWSPKFNLLTLRKGARLGQSALVDTTRVDQNKWSPAFVDSDWGALCWTLHDGVDHENYNTLWKAAKKGGIKKIGDRLSLQWKLSENKRAGALCFDENLKGQVTNRAQKRPCGKYGRRLQLMLCGEAEGSTYCSL